MAEQRPADRGIPDALLVGAIAFLLGVTLLVWTATGLSALLAHGAWPDGVRFTRTPQAMRTLATEPHDLATAWPDTPPDALSGWGLFWGLFIGQLMILITLTLATMTWLSRWRAQHAAAAAKASSWDEAPQTATRSRMPERAPEEQGFVPQPRMPPPAETEAETEAGTGTAGLQAFGQSSRGAGRVGEGVPHPPAQPAQPAPHKTPAPPEPLAAENPLAAEPRRGAVYHRTRTIAPAREALLAAAGPALVVTSSPDLWSDTKDNRSKLGPVLVYDPGQLCDTPDRLRWTPVRGSEDRSTATLRAQALLAPVRPRARSLSAVHDAAVTLLACWLHAAAIDARPLPHVHRWAAGGGQAQDPVRILRTSAKAASGSAGELESMLTAYPERGAEARRLVKLSLDCLSSLHIRNACNPTRIDALTLESFIDEVGTLYVVGEAIEDPRRAPGAMSLLTALATDVVEHGRRMAVRSSTGRLDPPLSLVLDDVAAVAPIPALPALLAADVLPLLAVMRSPEQAQDRWPEIST